MAETFKPADTTLGGTTSGSSGTGYGTSSTGTTGTTGGVTGSSYGTGGTGTSTTAGATTYGTAPAPTTGGAYDATEKQVPSEAGRTLLIGLLGGLVSAAGYAIYNRLPEDQKQRLQSQLRGVIESRLNEIRQNFNI